jgi:hypothetical protein
VKSQAKQFSQTAREHEEHKHAKQKNTEKVDDTFGFDDLFCARLGQPEEDQRAAASQTGDASENCSGSQTNPGAEPACSAAAATAAGSGQTFEWNWETGRGYCEINLYGET